MRFNLTRPLYHEPLPDSIAGHAPVVAEVRYYCQCGRRVVPDVPCEGAVEADVSMPVTHETLMRDRDRMYQVAKEAKRQAIMDTAVTYGGHIRKCQAMVNRPIGRWSEFGRCDRAPKLVIRHEGQPMAVCTQHAKMTLGLNRWSGSDRRRHEPAGNEAVEAIYVEALVKRESGHGRS